MDKSTRLNLHAKNYPELSLSQCRRVWRICHCCMWAQSLGPFVSAYRWNCCGPFCRREEWACSREGRWGSKSPPHHCCNSSSIFHRQGRAYRWCIFGKTALLRELTVCMSDHQVHFWFKWCLVLSLQPQFQLHWGRNTQLPEFPEKRRRSYPDSWESYQTS